MAGRVANCPSCGGQVEFKAGTSLLTICPYCSSAVARTGGDIGQLELLGKVAPLKDIGSPLHLGMGGKHKGKSFTLAGRQQLDYGAGPWNEWYAAFDDGTWGWVAEAQGKLYLTFAQPVGKLPEYARWKIGTRVTVGASKLVVLERRKARQVSAEGELPFPIRPGSESKYCDLEGPNGIFATIDFGEGELPETMYLGEQQSYEQVFGKEALREVAPAAAEAGARLECPSCGAGIELRNPGESMRVTCSRCDKLLDVGPGGALAAIGFAQARDAKKLGRDLEPTIPLGSTGEYKGAKWTLYGHLIRSVTVDAVRYPWDEYLLFSPGRGYRWLVQSNDHWSWIEPASAGDVSVLGLVASWKGTRFRHFQGGSATVEHLRGEFYWKVAAGEVVRTNDYVSPPLMLSEESTGEEVTWSVGTYLEKGEVERIFELKKPLARGSGVAPNQPNPHAATRSALSKLAAFFSVALCVMGLVVRIGSDNQVVFNGSFPMAGADGAPNVVLTEPFAVKSRSNMEIRARSAVDNNWIFLQGALINEERNEVRAFGVEVSYYHGVSGGESWSEGSTSTAEYLGSVAPGTYLIRFEPDWDKARGAPPVSHYEVEVRSDVFLASHFFLVLLFLWLPPVWALLKYATFEKRRWSESDHAS